MKLRSDDVVSTMRCGCSGVGAAVILPWLLLAITMVVSIGGWLPDGKPDPTLGSTSSPDQDELKVLRLATATLTTENQALRNELDRLLAQRRSRGAALDRPASTAGTEREAGKRDLSLPEVYEKEVAARLPELKEKLRRQLSLAAEGDEKAAKEAAQLLIQVLSAGAESFPALKELYDGADAQQTRQTLLPLMLFTGGQEAADFFATEVENETDEEFRRLMLVTVSEAASPEVAKRMTASFLRILATDADPAARAAVLRGLRYTVSDDVVEAVLNASRDGSDEVRLAAIENLVFRGYDSQRTQQIVAADASPHVRRIGECHLVISEGR